MCKGRQNPDPRLKRHQVYPVCPPVDTKKIKKSTSYCRLTSQTRQDCLCDLSTDDIYISMLLSLVTQGYLKGLLVQLVQGYWYSW